MPEESRLGCLGKKLRVVSMSCFDQERKLLSRSVDIPSNMLAVALRLRGAGVGRDLESVAIVVLEFTEFVLLLT